MGLLIKLILRMIFGDTESVEQDQTMWPTWVVALILIVMVGGLIGGYFWLASMKT